jgi:hypothetical protein
MVKIEWGRLALRCDNAKVGGEIRLIWKSVG